VSGDAAVEEAQRGSRCGGGVRGKECCKVKLERTRHKKGVFRQPCVVAGARMGALRAECEADGEQCVMCDACRVT
jgi:hypothetical protein